MIEASWLIFDNIESLESKKRDCLIRILDQGYVIQYRLSNKDDSLNRVAVLVFNNLREIAKGSFTIDNKWDIHCQNVKVLKKHRGNGIANAIYVLAEHFSGRIIWDYWGDKKTPDAVAFWAQENRPFGNRPQDNSKTISLY